MTNTFDLANANIPFGVLHDQLLSSIEYTGEYIKFTFDIVLYPEDYTNDVYDKYKEYKHCDMIVQISNAQDAYCSLSSSLNKKGKGKCIEFEIDELEKFFSNSNYFSFITCLANEYLFRIEFGVGFYNAKGKYRKYKHYGGLDITLAAKNISWEWY